MSVQTTYDRKHDVLYVRDALARIATSREHAIDSDLILNYDHRGRIVGVQFLWMRELRGMWAAHPARHQLPAAIRDEVDRFMSWLDAGPVDPEQCAARTVPPQWLLECADEESHFVALQWGQNPGADAMASCSSPQAEHS